MEPNENRADTEILEEPLVLDVEGDLTPQRAFIHDDHVIEEIAGGEHFGDGHAR